MRIILSIISIMIIAASAFLLYLNEQTTVSLKDFAIALPVWSIFISGILAGALWTTVFDAPVKRKFREYQKKLEKTSIQSEEGSSKISVLEEKIKVLEKALDNALGKND